MIETARHFFTAKTNWTGSIEWASKLGNAYRDSPPNPSMDVVALARQQCPCRRRAGGLHAADSRVSTNLEFDAWPNATVRALAQRCLDAGKRSIFSVVRKEWGRLGERAGWS